MGKLFGTDGIRGVANKELSVDLAMEVARARRYGHQRKNRSQAALRHRAGHPTVLTACW